MGKIPLADATLVEDPSEVQDEDASVCSASTRGSTLSVTESVNVGNRDFKIFVETKSGARHSIHLIAPTIQDKEAWISDISQCLDNIHMHSLLSPGIGGSSGGKHCFQTKQTFFVLYFLQAGFSLSFNFYLIVGVVSVVLSEKSMKGPSLQDIKRYVPTLDYSRMTLIFVSRERSIHANYLKFVTQLRSDYYNG